MLRPITVEIDCDNLDSHAKDIISTLEVAEESGRAATMPLADKYYATALVEDYENELIGESFKKTESRVLWREVPWTCDDNTNDCIVLCGTPHDIIADRNLGSDDCALDAILSDSERFGED